MEEILSEFYYEKKCFDGNNENLINKSVNEINEIYNKDNSPENLRKLGDIHRVCKNAFHFMRRKFKNRNRFYVKKFTAEDFRNLLTNQNITKDSCIQISYSNKRRADFRFKITEAHKKPYKKNNTHYSYYYVNLFIYFFENYESVYITKAKDFLLDKNGRHANYRNHNYEGKNIVAVFKCIEKSNLRQLNPNLREASFYDVAHDPDKPGTEQS